MHPWRLKLLVAAAAIPTGCALIGDLDHYSIDETITAGTGASAGGVMGGGGSTTSSGGGGQSCSGTEDCTNEIDDDCNGQTDCNDSYCSEDFPCSEIGPGKTCGEALSPCSVLLNCDNESQDGSETDVDCGGDPDKCETRCDLGQGCTVGGDCLSNTCLDQGQGLVCVPPVCGDGVTGGAEECDDGGTVSYDGCSPECRLEAGHLLISEVATTNDDKEFIELYNPSATSYALDNVYVSNIATYYDHTAWSSVPSPDFVVRFPTGSVIEGGGFIVMSLQDATKFHEFYGMYPDFDFEASDTNAPAMLMSDPSQKIEDNGMIVVFEWDGTRDLIRDHDYVLTDKTDHAMNKTGVTMGASTFMPETPKAMQVPSKKPKDGESIARCDTAELTETDLMGNGVDGDEETSEDFEAAFRKVTTPTPGMAPATVEKCDNW